MVDAGTDQAMSGGDAIPPFDPHLVPSAYLTADIAPIGGRIKERPEDFLVEEIPAYSPCGEGEHIYLFVEKRGMATSQIVRMLSRHFSVHRRAVGVAGLKDKIAVTRQLISVHTPGKRVEDFAAFEHPAVTILWASQHTNALRRGHLRANRFSVKIRGVDASGAIRADKIIRRLVSSGVPNRFGEQRFGQSGNNHIVGRALVKADWQTILWEMLGPGDHHPPQQAEARQRFIEQDFETARQLTFKHAHTEQSILKALCAGREPKRAAYAFDLTAKKFFISSLQSAIFNHILDQRLANGTFDELRTGDVAIKHLNHAMFAVDDGVMADPDTARRLRDIEISPSGPMWGEGMLRASGVTDEEELSVLNAAGIELDDLVEYGRKSGSTIPGTRRPLRVAIANPDVEGGSDDHGTYVRCTFELPKGAFATEVMREIMKPAGPPDPTATDAEYA